MARDVADAGDSAASWSSPASACCCSSLPVAHCAGGFLHDLVVWATDLCRMLLAGMIFADGAILLSCAAGNLIIPVWDLREVREEKNAVALEQNG